MPQPRSPHGGDHGEQLGRCPHEVALGHLDDDVERAARLEQQGAGGGVGRHAGRLGSTLTKRLDAW
jgi:hypothetical protein